MTTLDLPVARARTRLPIGTRILCALFFFSGFPALIYQLTWQRELFRLFGVNSKSVTIVVTAFMLGLGLGSLAGGWVSKQRGISLLPLLAAIEIATAAFGIVSLSVFEQVGAFIVNWPLAAMAAVNLLLVIVPTLLMGATLPILVSHLVRRSGQVGAAVGLLYYVNTLGAGAACLVCCSLLFPFIGMQSTDSCCRQHQHSRRPRCNGGARFSVQRGSSRTGNNHCWRPRIRAWHAAGTAIGGAWRLHFPVLRNLPVPHRLLRVRIECHGICRYAVVLSCRDRRRITQCGKKLRNIAGGGRHAQGF